MSANLEDLMASGFVAKDTSYSPGASRKTRLFKYRLRDNYTRFYLKYIEPIKPAIEQGLYEDVSLENLVKWDVIMGFQFENLVLNNLRSVCRALSIDMNVVLSASPYFQRKTKRREACQIDLLIQCRHTLYICEIRIRNKIRKDVIGDVQEKTLRLKLSKNISVRPILIYAGELSGGLVKEGYFDQCLSFTELLSLQTSKIPV